MSSPSPIIRGAVAWLGELTIGPLQSVTVLAKPAPASRPRVFRNGGIAYSKTYATFYGECQRQMGLALPNLRVLAGSMAAVLEVIITRPKHNTAPEPRGDVDNYAKGPLDAGTVAKLWNDDGQFKALAVVKRWAFPGEDQGVSISFGQLRPEFC